MPRLTVSTGLSAALLGPPVPVLVQTALESLSLSRGTRFNQLETRHLALFKSTDTRSDIPAGLLTVSDPFSSSSPSQPCFSLLSRPRRLLLQPPPPHAAVHRVAGPARSPSRKRNAFWGRLHKRLSRSNYRRVLGPLPCHWSLFFLLSCTISHSCRLHQRGGSSLLTPYTRTLTAGATVSLLSTFSSTERDRSVSVRSPPISGFRQSHGSTVALITVN